MKYSKFMNSPTLSFILPSRNAGIYLKHTLENLLDTSDARYEIILSLNNGTDPLPNFISEIKDSRLRVLRTEDNLSMSQNWYQGLIQTNGKWVCFVGSDDGIVARNLSQFIDLLESEIKTSIITNHTLAFHYAQKNKSAWLNLPKSKCNNEMYTVKWPTKLAAYFPQFYYDMPQPYSKAIIRKELLFELIKNENQIPGICPDIFLGNYAAMLSNRGIYIDLPVTVRGNSPVSIGGQVFGDTLKSQSTGELLEEFYEKERNLQNKFGPTCRPAVALDYYLHCKSYLKNEKQVSRIFLELWCNLSCMDKSHHNQMWNNLKVLSSLIYLAGLILRKFWFLKNFSSRVPKDEKILVDNNEDIYSLSRLLSNRYL